MRAHTLVVVVAAVVVATSAAPARADDALAEARELEAARDYDRALAVVERTIARGGNDPDRLAELYLLAGKLAASLDRPGDAEAQFARYLAMRPTAHLPDGASPTLTAPFLGARAKTPALRVEVTRHGDLVAIAADPDPLGVVGIRVRVVDRDGHASDIVKPHALVVLVPSDSTAIEIAALDAANNRVWVAAVAHHDGVWLAPPKRSATAIGGGPAGTPRYARWTTWGIVAGGALVVAGASAWRFEVAQRDWNRLRDDPMTHDYASLHAVEDRGNRWALAANVGFGVAAAAGLAAAVTFLAEHDEPHDRRGVRSLAITAGATSIGVAGRF